MLYYLTAAALVLHAYFWGAGLSWLALPRPWRPFWWVFAPGFGLALQSAVVWVGAHTSAAGTDSYAAASELLPLGLIGLAWKWQGGGRTLALLRHAQAARAVAVMMVLAGWMLLWPMAQRGGWTLTTSSLGSCDHADYAAGARVFQEFSKDDRTGYLGLPEVTRVRSSEYFFDYFVRQNHFTPSALIAHSGAVFGLRPHQLVSVTSAVLLLLNLPAALFLARAMAGLRGAALLAVGALYALSPLGAYGVHHGALGQMLAAQGIALLTLTAYGAGRARGPAGAWSHLPLALTAVWLLAGSYNFILAIAFAPAAAWLLSLCGLRRDWRPSFRVAMVLAAALVICALVFWGRFAGIADRFALFKQYNFGWPIPLLLPDGWLGIGRDRELAGWPGPRQIAFSAAVVALFIAGLLSLGRRDPSRGLAALALVVPIVAGWTILAWESRERANAGYDAYKLIVVFAPGLLAGLLGWTAWLADRRRPVRGLATALVVSLVVANVGASGEFRRVMANPPLRVDGTLLQVARLEREPSVDSVNMRIDQFWSRLWANALLLRKPQYFLTHTYEARLNTPLRGEWDLSDSLLRSVPESEEDFIDLNPSFHAVRVGSAGRILLEHAGGWHERESLAQQRWRWCDNGAAIQLTNSSSAPIGVELDLRLQAVRPRRLDLQLNGETVGHWDLDREPWRIQTGRITLPPGVSRLVFGSISPSVQLPNDSRHLSFALYGLEIRALPGPVRADRAVQKQAGPPARLQTTETTRNASASTATSPSCPAPMPSRASTPTSVPSRTPCPPTLTGSAAAT